MKVIQVIGHSISKLNLGVAPLRFENEWHICTAKEIVRRTDKYEIDCWQPEASLHGIHTRKGDGISHTYFPAFYWNIKGARNYEFSVPMLKELKKLRSEKVLVHLHDPFQFACQLIPFFYRNIPVIATSHGGRYSAVMRQVDKINPFQRIALNNIDSILVDAEAEKDYYARIKGGENGIDSMITIAGVDFDKFQPMDKKEARNRLGLPLDKKLILYVGRLYKLKGVDILLRAFQGIKSKYNAELVLAGHWPDDPLLAEVQASGARVVPYIPQEQLVPYYSAADIYVAPMFDKTIASEGGIGIAPIESMACSTPVVSPSLKFFPQQEAYKVGRMPREPEEVETCISAILDDPAPYSDCRNTAKRYYDWEVVVDQITAKYEELFNRYYSS